MTRKEGDDEEKSVQSKGSKILPPSPRSLTVLIHQILYIPRAEIEWPSSDDELGGRGDFSRYQPASSLDRRSFLSAKGPSLPTSRCYRRGFSPRTRRPSSRNHRSESVASSLSSISRSLRTLLLFGRTLFFWLSLKTALMEECLFSPFFKAWNGNIELGSGSNSFLVPPFACSLVPRPLLTKIMRRANWVRTPIEDPSPSL